jgi:hypothetical protein
LEEKQIPATAQMIGSLWDCDNPLNFLQARFWTVCWFLVRRVVLASYSIIDGY